MSGKCPESISCVALDFQRALFERFRPEVERALRHAGDTMTYEDLWGEVDKTMMQAWLAADGRGCMFTEIVDYPRLRAVRVVIVAGHLKSCLTFKARVHEWALQIGASRIEWMGRRGWLRAVAWPWRSITMGWATIDDLAKVK